MPEGSSRHGRSAPDPDVYVGVNIGLRKEANMHRLSQLIFFLATITFVLCWITGAWSILLLRQRIRREGRVGIPVRELFDTGSAGVQAYPEARRFMQALMVAAISWCVGLAAGLGSGILH